MDRYQHPLAPARKSRARIFAGLVLCALVVVFSLAAKVSWYHRAASPAASISKQKAFKAEPPAHTASEAAIPVPLTAIPVVIALSALFLFEAGCVERKERPRSARTTQGFQQAASARPPPAR